ncbi:MAG: signal recognition particle-docking protein FtsY [Pseudomonadales bacterium]
MAGNVAEDKREGKSAFGRIRTGLAKTRGRFADGLQNVLGGKSLDEGLVEELETLLLSADVGVAATGEIIAGLTSRLNRGQVNDGDAVHAALKTELIELLKPVELSLLPENPEGPFVILMVGVNGAGKTTTIGKLAKQFQAEGKEVLLAAGDTFRAAAVEQLQAWGESNQVPVIAQQTGADSASVCFDALQAAKSRGADILIADTAGRLQNKQHLMDELSKVARVIAKVDASAPHEVLLVLDAGTGQNAIAQASEFQEAVAVTGLVVSKLDGSAKGGVIFAIAKQLGIPIRFIGVGEGADDLRPFSANDFVEALLD